MSAAPCMGCMRRSGERVCAECGYRDGAHPVSRLHLPPRTVVGGRYELGRVLGQGGFAITYIARDISGKEIRKGEIPRLAIKEYFPSMVATRTEDRGVTHSEAETQGVFHGWLAAFAQEGRTLMELQKKKHPNIVEFLDFFEANGTGYIVMRYVDGKTLLQYLDQKGGRIPFGMALQILFPVMDALRLVHGESICHRDIAPDNIFISETGKIKILDFGSTRGGVALTGGRIQVFVKPGYSPEEQYRADGAQGPWTDVYALAATLYRCITGGIPPSAELRCQGTVLTPPSSLGVDIPPASEAALLRALALQAAGRYQSIAAFQQAITPGALDSAPHKPEPALPARVCPAVEKGRYLAGFGLAFGLGEALMIASASWADDRQLARGAGFLLFFFAFLVSLGLVYKAWSLVQDGQARMSPSRAVGLSFVPLLNLVWPLEVFWGFAKSYNSYLERHRLSATRLPEGLFLAFAILGVMMGLASLMLALGLSPAGSLVIFIPCYIVGLMVMNLMCGAVNSLAAVGNKPGAAWPTIISLSRDYRGSAAEISPRGLIVGRSPLRANVVIADAQVSNAHARLWCQSPDSGVWLEDLASRTGTFCYTVSGSGRYRWERIIGRAQLQSGQRFRIGESGVEFEVRRA